MEQVFTWTGFICLTILAIAITFYLCVAMLDVALNRTKVLHRWFKRFSRWHKSFPKRDHIHRFAFTVYDFESGEFMQSKYHDHEMLTDEERKRMWESWRLERKEKSK